MMMIIVASVRGWRLNHVFTRTPPFASEMSGWLMMMRMIIRIIMMINDYNLLSSRVGSCVGDFKFNYFFGLERLVTTLERLVTTQVETLVMLDLIWAK